MKPVVGTEHLWASAAPGQEAAPALGVDTPICCWNICSGVGFVKSPRAPREGRDRPSSVGEPDAR